MRQKILSAAIAAITLSLSSNASADIISADWIGAFTLLTPTGGVFANPDSAGGAGINDDVFGARTTIGGLLFIDTNTGAGSGTISSFLFGGNLASVHDFTLQAVGDGMGGVGTLVIGSLLFDWATNLNIPVHLVWDAQGFFSNGSFPIGDIIDGGTGSSLDTAITASVFGPFAGEICSGGAEDGGAAGCPFAMTTLDVNQDINGNLINSGLPLTDDGISGVPMIGDPYPSHSVNIDITEMTITDHPPPVPVPAAIWLFGSGLLGLIHVARRKSHS